MSFEPSPMRIIADGFHFAEGPVLLPDGDILVCETHGPGLLRVSPSARRVSPYASTQSGANGAAIGPDGAIYICNNGGGRVVFETLPNGTVVSRPPRPGESVRLPGRIQRAVEGGEAETLYDSCDGRALMSPNDIVFDRNGCFYFTDYGFFAGQIREAGVAGPDEEANIVRTLGMVMRSPVGSVFYASAKGDMIREVIHPLAGANGVGLSPDETTLYVAESVTSRLWAFELPEAGRVGRRRCLGTLPFGTPTNVSVADSMVVAADGSIIVGTILHGGLSVFSPDGSSIRHIPTGDMYTTNACFGGADMQSLYVTLGRRGGLGVFDRWPVRGLDLNYSGTPGPVR